MLNKLNQSGNLHAKHGIGKISSSYANKKIILNEALHCSPSRQMTLEESTKE